MRSLHHQFSASIKSGSIGIFEHLKGYGNIFLFGLSIRTFGVIAISVVNFFEACSVSEILKDKRH